MDPCTGLDVTSQLGTCAATSTFESPLVIVLFFLQSRDDGHWVTPHRDFPLLLNAEPLHSQMLLSHGA